MKADDKYKQIFSKNLNYYMDLRGKSQTDIIDDLGINKSAISSWCNGTRLPRMNKVQLLADYLNVNLSNLIEDSCEDSNYFEYIAEDDAMYPLLDIGDISLIHKQNTIDTANPVTGNAGTYLVEMNKQYTIRRFIESQDKTYYTLQGMNMSCKPINIKKEELQDKITILGKVVKAENQSAFK